MLEHQKIVLKGVSDNSHLFRKELYKSLKWLSVEELKTFNQWVYTNFHHKQPEIVNEFISDKNKISA